MEGIGNQFKKADGGIDAPSLQLADEAWRDFDLFGQVSKGHPSFTPEVPNLLTDRKNERIHGFNHIIILKINLNLISWNFRN